MVLRVDARDPDPVAMSRAAAILRDGGLVAFPTDTVYGLAVDPRQDDAVERLFDAKGRERGMAIPLIAGRIEQALEAARLGARERRLAEAFWPGPLSIVLPALPTIAAAVRGPGDTVAVRVPAHAVARALALAFGFRSPRPAPISPARPAAASADAIDPTLAARLDAVIDVGAAPGGPPSTIVELTPEGPRLVRAGAIAWDRVLKSLE